MKKIVYLMMVLPLFLFSCQSNPEAYFHTDNADPEVGQEVFFINDSHNGKRFEWDFGDGYISNDEHPSHIYTGTGSYEVILTVYSKNGLSDKASMTIAVMIPTLLEVTVREYYEEYLVPGASVILYSSSTDWDNESNPVTEGQADADGIAVFSHLGPFVYYADVWEAAHDNYTLRNEDIAFIRTPEILPHKINRFIAYVDKANHAKGDGTSKRRFVITKIERRATDKMQPGASEGTDGWQELYNKSIKLKKR